MQEINYQKIDELVKNDKLTENDVNAILDAMKENAEKYEDIRVINEINAHPQKPSSTGDYIDSVVKIDPVSGEKVKIADNNITEKVSLDDKLKSVGSIKDNTEIEPEEIKAATEASDIFKNSDYKISDEAIMQLIKVMNRYRDGEKINIYNEYPQEIKDIIDKYMINHGYGIDQSPKTNRIRKFFAKQILDEYISIIDKSKSNKSFTIALESMWQDTNTDLLDFYKDYPEKSDQYLNSMMNGEDNVDKKILMNMVLKSIYDSYSLQRMITSPKKIKIKSFEYEKPEKVFREIESKYRDKHKYNITALRVAYQVLSRYDKNKDEALQFLILFCKFCASYNPENVAEHAFMYYTINNITLLDVAKVKEDNDYISSFLSNIHQATTHLLK